MRALLSLTIVALFDVSSFAATIQVPGDQPTIQAGIEAASAGDTVLVASGTYTGDGNRDIGLLGKAITLKSETGLPEDCTIDCNGTAQEPHCGFYLDQSEGHDTLIKGFTITKGYPYGDSGHAGHKAEEFTAGRLLLSRAA